MLILWDDDKHSAAYDDACWATAFNARRPKRRRPRAVAKARSEEDVLTAVRLAIQLSLRVAVRSGGHSFEAWSIQDNSIMVDLCDYKQVNVDPVGRRVTATPSVTSRELMEALEFKSLFFPSGHCPDVGLGGFLLQGGMGWNCANWGWACEFLQGVDVVTAEGVSLYCDTSQNSDLFWAARGGGPAFPGIVIRFHLIAMPNPQVIRSSSYVFPRALYETAFRWALTLLHELDTDTELTAKAHFQQSVPCFSIIATTFKSNINDAMQALQPIQSSRPAGTMLEGFCTPESMSSLYAMQASANPKNHRWTIDSGFLVDSSDEDIVSTLAESFCTLPHEKSYAFWTPMRPWSKIKIPDMALSQQADHYFAVYTIWEDESDDQRCQGWLRSAMKDVIKSCIGAYVGDSEFSNRRTQYWSRQSTERLMEIRQKWDPQGRIAGGYPTDEQY
ncbi:FAD-binding domain-containing protein [Penicillium brevicompactum]|uniref:FAD-binding domain-containing protein n=1 Tax=Penicillium brevicompactum TaxID=5074 RepID=A0A9W9Q9L2_PENBR|nr:FAD-binding domain-containing protein [Penicillium brevicompactum]